MSSITDALVSASKVDGSHRGIQTRAKLGIRAYCLPRKLFPQNKGGGITGMKAGMSGERGKKG